MSLEPGTRLGPYEILGAIGAGGMGEVYKAQDTRLNRVVALKVMPTHFAQDPEMKQRFDREAQAIASLNHPNICVLHDVGTGGEQDFFVMELLEGETLEQRLERGRDPSTATRLRASSVPATTSQAKPGSGSGRSVTKLLSRPFTIEEALGIAIQIADALDKAHQQGIIHRDLKPANVMLSKGSGLRPGAYQVKLLDFGLAKWKPQPDSLASAVTVQADLTMKGAVLGTMRYMAPEQLEGEEADARTDIFAFGTVLYEIITGKKAFDGKNQPSLAGAIMNAEPLPVSRLQPLTPPPLERVIKRCLAKDPEDRWQTAHDLLIQLRWIADVGGAAGEPDAAVAKPKKKDRLAMAGIALGVLLTAAAAWPAWSYFQGPPPPEMFQIRVTGYGLSQGSISPDGKWLAVVAKPNVSDTPALYIRPVGGVNFRRVGGAEDATLPFWSPDSKSVAFLTGTKLKKVNALSGSPEDIADAPGFTGGTWSRQNVILFGSAAGLQRVSAEGGAVESVTTVEKPETGHYWPHFLPDGRHFLYLAWSTDVKKRAVMVGALDSKDRRTLIEGETNAQYAEPGFIVFRRGATVFAQRFDAESQSLHGDPVQVAGGITTNASDGRGAFEVSHTGALLYHQAGAGGAGRAGINNTAVFGWRDRQGKTLGQLGEQGPYGDIDLSPEGKRVAITRQDPGAPGADIWVTDVDRPVTQKITLDLSDDLNPVWSPDGRRIAFSSFRNGNWDVLVMNANGVGGETALLNSPADEMIEDWSKDGRHIVYKLGRGSYEDLYALPLDADGKPGKPFPVMEGKYHKDEAQFSYDGKWLAYTSDESGTFQVYVITFPGMAKKHQVTPPEGGGQPRWRRDGKELFYRGFDNTARVVDITLGEEVTSGVPRVLFVGPVNAAPGRDPVRHQWSVTPDGQKFLVRLPNGSGVANFSGTPQAQNNYTSTTASGGPTSAPSPLTNGLTVMLGWQAAFNRGVK